MGDGQAYVARAVVFAVDPSPAQERLLRSYCGAARFAYNWVIGEVTGNLTTRTAERDAGVGDADLTPSLSWSKFSLQRVGFPSFKSRHTAKLSVSFVVLNHQLSWLDDSRHAIRLMLPQALVQSKDPHTRRVVKQLVWLHTVESTRRLYRLVEDGRATIQKVTISYIGGRWQAAFTVRYQYEARPVKRPRISLGGAVGVDVGLTHLATLSRHVPDLTDEHGHVSDRGRSPDSSNG